LATLFDQCIPVAKGDGPERTGGSTSCRLILGSGTVAEDAFLRFASRLTKVGDAKGAVVYTKTTTDTFALVIDHMHPVRLGDSADRANLYAYSFGAVFARLMRA